MNLRKVIDRCMKYSIFAIGGFNVIIVFLIFLFILTNSMEAFKEVPVSKFFFGKEWISLSEKYGLLPLLSGTFRVTFVALAISVPISIMSAVYMSEYAGKKTRDIFKMLIETMSALPSVVLGYIGLYALSGPVKEIFNLKHMPIYW